ncbi:olpB, partial [Symbiodinium sp. KB8]
MGTSRACSCMSDFIPAHEAYSSPAEVFFRQPFVFTGKVLSVQPVDGRPGEQSEYCAAPPAAHDKRWGNPCTGDYAGHFDRWNRCGRKHVAEVQVGAEVLDGTPAGGATSFCGSRRCELGGWDAYSCQQLLKALQQKRPAESRKLQVSLPVAFSTLTANQYFRGQLLKALVRDVLDALNLSKFDI